MEHVQDAHRLALMNLMLHGLDSNPEGAGIRSAHHPAPAHRHLLCPGGQDQCAFLHPGHG
ncbi:hypothetical protein [uncultured Thiodictyon sp.]|uniref:hypothetical protein n=1 Tax=uncultured Thiodictyon sp. TaxID=1846217 RepID=UPI003457C942